MFKDININKEDQRIECTRHGRDISITWHNGIAKPGVVVGCRDNTKEEVLAAYHYFNCLSNLLEMTFDQAAEYLQRNVA